MTPSATPGDPLAPATPELTLKPGDEAPLTQGDALGRPEAIDFTEPGNPGQAGEEEARPLSDDDVERVFAPARRGISACITSAVGDYPLESARVEVGYRIERSGRVERVRVTAPALLQSRGLSRCVRPVVTALRFPRSPGASVVTFPFDLQ